MPDYGALFKVFEPIYATSWDKTAMYVSMGLIVLFLGVEFGLKWIFKQSRGAYRWSFYLGAIFLFLTTISGVKASGFAGLIRYMLPWYVLLVLCAAHISTELTKPRKFISVSLIFGICISLFLLTIQFQIPHWVDFLNGRWFA